MRPRGAGPVVAVRELRGSRRRGGDGHRVPHRAHGRLRLVANRYTAALYGRPGHQLSRSYTGQFLPERPRHPAVRDRLRVLGTSPASLPSLWVPALALALAVGWARVFLGAHYPRDIAGRPRGGPRDRRHRDPARQGGCRLDLDACGPAARTARRQCGASRQVIVNREDGCHDASPHDPRRRSCRLRAWPFATELGRLMPREKPE